MFDLLKQPVPFRMNPWKVILTASLCVFFVLAVFQPFGLSYASGYEKWIRVLGFPIVTAVSTAIVVFLLPLLSPSYFQEANWTWGRHLLSTFTTILLVTAGNILFNALLSGGVVRIGLNTLLAFLIITFSVGLIPMVLIGLFTQNIQLKQNLKEAKELNLHLQSKDGEEGIHQDTPSKETVTLTGTTKESLTLQPERFLYAESSGNYVKIVHLADEAKPAHILLRTTIAQAASAFEAYPGISRCHRAYLVNTQHIVNVEGNSQGFSLTLRHAKEEVPVSRTYTGVIRELLADKA